MKKFFITTISILLVSGCASNKKIVETEYVDYNKDIVIRELQEISKSIKESMMIMARNDNALKSEILTAEQIRYENKKATYVASGMERKIPFLFKGPAVKALKALADTSDYEFVLGGKKPIAMLEPIVIINEKRMSISKLIKLIESKTKNRLEVIIREFEGRRILEVNYV